MLMIAAVRPKQLMLMMLAMGSPIKASTLNSFGVLLSRTLSTGEIDALLESKVARLQERGLNCWTHHVYKPLHM